MNDQELGQFLRDEVPPPKAGYWDAIDASLGGATLSLVEEIPAERETEDNLVRLTDMNFNPSLTRGRREGAWIALVAAAAVIIGGFAFVLNLERNDGISSAATEGALQNGTTLSDVAVDDLQGQADASTENNPPVDESSDDETEGTVSWRVVWDGPVNLRKDPTTDGQVIFKVPNGWPLEGTGRTEEADGFTWIEVFEVEARELGWVPRQFLELASAGTTPLEEALGEPAPADITEGEAETWDVDYGVGMNHRRDPGLTGEIIGSWAGDETGLAGTGRTATVDGELWIELAATDQNGVGWVIGEALRPEGAASTNDVEISDVADAPFDIYEGDRLLWDVAADFGVDLRYEPSYDSGIFANASATTKMVWGSGRLAIVDGEEWVELNLYHESMWAPMNMLNAVGSAPGYALDDPPPSWINLRYSETFDWTVDSAFGINVRNGPSETSPTIASFDDGHVFGSLGLIAEVDGVEWVYVDGVSDEGAWVARDFVLPAP